MTLEGEQVLLRVWVDRADRAPLTPTYERLVKAARADGLAGVTVLEGIAGYGPAPQRGAWGLGLAEHRPVILEIVDAGARVAEFLDTRVRALMARGLVTLERAHVMMWRAGAPGQVPLRLGGMLDPLSTLPAIEPRDAMTIDDDGVLLRAFLGESDRFEGQLLYRAIVEAARQAGLAGATVLRGVEGFGAKSVVHKAGLLEMSADLPIVVEIVDAQARIDAFLPQLGKMVGEGMVTLEQVRLIRFGGGA